MGDPRADRRAPRVRPGAGCPLHGRLTGRRRPGTGTGAARGVGCRQGAPAATQRRQGGPAGVRERRRARPRAPPSGSGPPRPPPTAAPPVRRLRPAARSRSGGRRAAARCAPGRPATTGRARRTPTVPGTQRRVRKRSLGRGRRSRRLEVRGGLDGRRHAGRHLLDDRGLRGDGPRRTGRRRIAGARPDGRGPGIGSACGQHLHDRARVRRVGDPLLRRPGERGAQAETARAGLR